MVNKTEGCWLWRGSRTTRGYPRFTEHGKTFSAHRYAVELAEGYPLGPGEQANHACDNPPCVRYGPGHLSRGTQADNIADAMTKGRMAMQRPGYCPPRAVGIQHGRALLNDSTIRQIRELRAAGWSQQAIADLIGTDQTNVSAIVRRKTWKHVA
jgi:hypothetical protein